ncbi:MAG: 5-formyltetrahydrofolate cyclo-ligase [Spongiibacteraceae bacterium]|jgi:5-formyltetrahydrofolate cyclo-ligase|nr:5-formyltetrahydrofolate cyclo-ligase [Spongiibacteraceae bacterium]
MDRSALRRQLRRRRQSLTRHQQQRAARRLAAVVLRRPELRRVQHIALYLPQDGEISPLPLVNELLARGKCVYLPVLRPGSLLRFRRFPAARMRRNRFGIAEPLGRDVRPEHLDLVFLPLVGFDRYGGRLGMGGGYYDRSFAFVRSGRVRRPLLVGLGHAFQEVERLPIEPWDVPLAAIATERRWLAIGRFAQTLS